MFLRVDGHPVRFTIFAQLGKGWSIWETCILVYVFQIYSQVSVLVYGLELIINCFLGRSILFQDDPLVFIFSVSTIWIRMGLYAANKQGAFL